MRLLSRGCQKRWSCTKRVSSKPIVLLAGVLTDEELAAAIEHRFEIVVHCQEQLELLQRCNSGGSRRVAEDSIRG